MTVTSGSPDSGEVGGARWHHVVSGLAMCRPRRVAALHNWRTWMSSSSGWSLVRCRRSRSAQRQPPDGRIPPIAVDESSTTPVKQRIDEVESATFNST